MMVGSPDIDEFVVASANFISYIGDVGAEISRYAIGTDDYAVFIIAVFRRTEPEGTVFFIHIVFIFEDFEGQTSTWSG